MRGAFGLMAAAAAAAVVAAWRRVHRDGIEARLAERAARAVEAPRDESQRPERVAAESAESIRIVRRHGAEPAAAIRIVRRRAEPAEPIRVVRRSAGPPEPVRPEAKSAAPARGESSRAEPPEPVHKEPPEPVHAEPPFPAEAPERGRDEPPATPTAAWQGGSAPGPARVPRPMYWPAFLALGAVWAAWGSISTPLLIFGGIAVFAVALALWIREMIHAD